MKNKRQKIHFKPRFFVILFLLIVLFFFGITEIVKLNSKKVDEKDHPSISKQKENDEKETVSIPDDISIKMTVVGDIMCHNTQFQDAYNSNSNQYDFSYVFEDIKDKLSSADITVGNLETTFAGAKRGYSGYPTFNTPEALAQNLKDLGFDLLCTANNHSLDKGYSGIENTINELDKVQISHTGTYSSEEKSNEIIVKDVNGIKIAFLAYTYGTNGISIPKDNPYCINLIDKDKIKSDLDKAKNLDVDVITVFMHWGIEYRQTPTDEQKELADFLFQNGADIILGSHPHVLETMEKRTVTLEDGTQKDGFLIYSLGNFISGQVKEYTKQSIILDLKITKHGKGNITIDSAEYTPIYMYKSSASSKRYKVLDIESEITKYDNGNSTVSSSTYNTLKSELSHIYKIMGDEILPGTTTEKDENNSNN